MIYNWVKMVNELIVIVLSTLFYISRSEDNSTDSTSLLPLKPVQKPLANLSALKCHYEKPPRAIMKLFGDDDFGEPDVEECDGGFCIKYVHRDGTARGCSQVGIGLTVSGFCKNMSKKNSCVEFQGGQLCCCNDRNLCNSSSSWQTGFVVLFGLLYVLV
ncbi:hypothetical protein L596_016549 [Steinernema carpocapsae]|uniref:Activin types I and II receptor domain-containing protein n=1 Tax=Steinernema carpocapsae TaxID=34508 RepID=A0A4V6A3H1_STECR|nr:hypothetical protein L596_016549 [Steinernema carpocapsae]